MFQDVLETFSVPEFNIEGYVNHTMNSCLLRIHLACEGYQNPINLFNQRSRELRPVRFT